jgi:4'-phosphopantetheinyl transferase
MRLSHYLRDFGYVDAKPLNSPGISWRKPDGDLNLSRNECHIWAINLDQGGECVRRLTRYLSPTEARKASQFYGEIDQHRYTVGRSLLKILLGIYTGVEPDKLELQTRKAGKPYLPNIDLQFSKTASGSFGLIAITLEINVGVDIEKIKKLDEAAQLIKSAFSNSEHLAFQKMPPSKRSRAFFRGWTRKEAIVKALGTGLGIAPDQFTVSLDPSPAYEFNIPGIPAELPANWTLRSWSPAADYQAAIAIRSSNVALSFYS